MCRPRCVLTIGANDLCETVTSDKQLALRLVLLVFCDDTSIDTRQTIDLNVDDRSLEGFESFVNALHFLLLGLGRPLRGIICEDAQVRARLVELEILKTSLALSWLPCHPMLTEGERRSLAAIKD